MQWQERNQNAQFTGLYPTHGKAKSAKEAFDLVMVNAPGASSQKDEDEKGAKGVKDPAKITNEPHSDPEKEFPNATPDEIRHLRVLQEQKKALLEQLQKQRTEKMLVSRQGLGAYVPKHHQEPLLVKDNNRWHIIGHSEEKLIQVECNNREEVLVHKCAGIEHQIRIKIIGPCSLLHIEECHNIKFVIDALLFAGAISDSTAIEAVLGAEVPNLLLRNVRGCDLTLCPENMDGGIETVNCSGVSVHSVFRGGFLALEPADLMRAPTKYVAQIPDRVYTMMQGHQVISECRGHRNLANATQAWWTQRAAELESYGRP